MNPKPLIALLALASLSAAAAQPEAIEPPNSKPVAEHKLIDKFIGTWDYHVVLTFGPGQKFEGKGKTVGKSLLKGLFVQLDSQGPLLGKDFQNITTLGFDTRFKKYTLWGIDSFGTYSVSAQGTYDEATKTLTLLGENEEPGMGKVGFKFAYTFTDDTHITQTLHMKFGETWQQITDIKFTKAL